MHISALPPTVDARSAGHSSVGPIPICSSTSQVRASRLGYPPLSKASGSHPKRTDSYSSLVFELELEDGSDVHASVPRYPLELLWGSGTPQELWMDALSAKEALLLDSHSSGQNQHVDVAAFAELLAEKGYQTWLRHGRYTASPLTELGLSNVKHTFVVVSLPGLAGHPNYYVCDPNYKEHFMLSGSGTAEYLALLSLLPSVFVGGAEQWIHLVDLLCKEMEKVFSARGVPLPPWRSPCVMQGHWLVNHADDIQISPPASMGTSRAPSADLGTAAAAAAVQRLTGGSPPCDKACALAAELSQAVAARKLASL